MFYLEKIVKVKDGLITLPVRIEDGRAMLVTVGDVPRPRSLKANRYWWAALMRALADYTGDTEENCHEWLVLQLAPMEIVDPITGEIKTVRKRTSKMTSAEFAELCLKAQELCQSIGLQRISPEQYWEGLSK